MTEAIIRIVNDNDAVLNEAAERFKKNLEIRQKSTSGFHLQLPCSIVFGISPKRWQLIEHLQHLGPSTIRGLARSLDRDVKRVHDDVTAMIDWGLVERNDDGMVHVPYSVIHTEFDLRAVA